LIDVKGSTPRGVAAKMIVLPDGTVQGTIGGGLLEKQVIEDAVHALANGGGGVKRYVLAATDEGGIGQICGGEASVLIEVVGAPDTMLICGGGHIAAALAPMAAALDMNLVIADDRARFASKERFPDGATVLNMHPGDERLRKHVTRSTYVIIVTHNHLHDAAALENLIAAGAAYIGMIGSTKKIRAVFSELEKNGVPRESLARVHSPVGLDIGAETPAEIAVSIMAEIISVKRKGPATTLSMKHALDRETRKA
jgi:xanthine dehydrogenase accessory factor